jgi:hypothetical protein
MEQPERYYLANGPAAGHTGPYPGGAVNVPCPSDEIGIDEDGLPVRLFGTVRYSPTGRLTKDGAHVLEC